MIIFKLMLTLMRREWKSILLYVIIFFFFTIMNARTASENSFSLSSYKVALVDEQQDEDSEALYNYLAQHHKVEKVELDPITAKEHAYLGRYDAILYAKEDGVQALASPYSARGFSVISDTDNYLRYKEVVSTEEELNQLMNIDVPVHFEVAEVDTDYKVTWTKYFFLYSGYIILAVGILVVGHTIIDMSKEEIYLRTKISPVSSVRLYAETLLALLVALVLFILFITLGGSVVLKTSIINAGTIKFLPGVILMGISGMALATLVASAFKSKVVVGAVSSVLSLVLSFISGIFVPAELLPNSILAVGKLFPLYYYVQYLDKQRIFDLAMIVLFILVYLLLGIFVTRERRKAH